MYQHPFLRTQHSVPDRQAVAGQLAVVVSIPVSIVSAQQDMSRGGCWELNILGSKAVNILFNIVDVQVHFSFRMIDCLKKNIIAAL